MHAHFYFKGNTIFLIQYEKYYLWYLSAFLIVEMCIAGSWANAEDYESYASKFHILDI